VPSPVLRNALRYAGHVGPITVTARKDGSSARISVADRGPGIPEEHLPRVFDTFHHLEPDRNRSTGGVGLGLAIVRTCVECCGGVVRARNRQRGGLRVTIELKAATSPAGRTDTGSNW
jgi:two-component system, OmpR family, sensor histidine kinase CpxA